MTLTHHGHRFAVSTEHDPDTGPPWKEYDGYGIVSDWTSRPKRPGERILKADRHASMLYDVQASTAKALAEQWSCAAVLPTDTAHQKARKAVDADFEYLRAWANDEWQYVIVKVRWIAPDGEVTDHRTTLGGVEDSDPKYLDEVARELANDLIAELLEWLDRQLAIATARREALA